MNRERMLAVHRVYHDFMSKFMDGANFVDRGWSLMKAVEEWAADYPDDVHVVQVDDWKHTCSSLVLIEHKVEGEYWGTTAVVIPQNVGEPCTFSMYPRRVAELTSILIDIGRKSEGDVVC